MSVMENTATSECYGDIIEGYERDLEREFVHPCDGVSFPGTHKNLWWVASDDHSEDWFVVAETPDDALRFFADYEGYDLEDEDIWAQWVSRIPHPLDGLEDEEWGGRYEGFDPHHPTDEDLLAAGGKCVGAESPRQWTFGLQTFVEGGLEAVISSLRDDVFEARGDGRPNGTVKSEEA